MSNMNLHGGQNNGAPAQVNVSADDLTMVACECGSQVFQQGIKVGKLSSVHPKNPTGEDQLLTLPVTVCMSCGEQVEIK